MALATSEEFPVEGGSLSIMVGPVFIDGLRSGAGWFVGGSAG